MPCTVSSASFSIGRGPHRETSAVYYARLDRTLVQALHKARIRDVGVIEALSKIGELVKNKARRPWRRWWDGGAGDRPFTYLSQKHQANRKMFRVDVPMLENIEGRSHEQT